MNPENLKFKAKVKHTNKLFNVNSINSVFKSASLSLEKSSYVNYDFKDIEKIIQWTGFIDKKENEIYEYDILNIDGELHMVKFWRGEIILPFWPIDYNENDLEKQKFEEAAQKHEKEFLDDVEDFCVDYVECIIRNQPSYHYTGWQDYIPYVYEKSRVFEVVGNKFEGVFKNAR